MSGNHTAASKAVLLGDLAAIVIANLASFGLGELINQSGWLPFAS
jgi:hypothetical protein